MMPADFILRRSRLLVMGILNVTPVSAFGMNFGYIQEDPEENVVSVFDFKDNGLLSDSIVDIQEYSLQRKVNYNEQILNFTIKKIPPNVEFKFNYHLN